MSKDRAVMRTRFRFGTQAVFEFGDSNFMESSPRPIKPTDSQPWYKWGADDMFPDLMFKTVYSNDIKPDLVETSVNLLLGEGLNYYLKERKDGKVVKNYAIVDEFEVFSEANDIPKFLMERATNLELSANAFTDTVQDKGKVVKLINKAFMDCRPGYYDEEEGRILDYFLSGAFGNRSAKKPVYHAEDPKKSNVLKMAAYDFADTNSANMMHHSKYYLPGQDYLSFPIWWFGTQDWAELSSLIVKYQVGNVKNAANIKLHIRIPDWYLDQFGTDPEDEKRVAAEDELQQQLDELLLNTDPSKRVSTFMSHIRTLTNGDTSGFEILPIKVDANDKVFLETFKVASMANSRGHGLHPTLSGIDIDGKLSSGSEIKNLFNYHVIAKLPKKRQTLLEIFYDVKRKNGWPKNLEFEINYQQMVTQDVNHAGVVSTNPTTPTKP